VIEAKRDEAGDNITDRRSPDRALCQRHAEVAHQDRAAALPVREHRPDHPLHRRRDPAPRSREIFHFFQPAAGRMAAPARHLARPPAERMPALPAQNLRDCQVSAVTGLEKSLAQNKPRALVHMATGAGKTFTAITAVYRLLKFGGAKRILFLVDTRNLGKQAHQEFMAYTPPDDGRKFTELYNVQRLAGPQHRPACAGRASAPSSACIRCCPASHRRIGRGHFAARSAADRSAGQAGALQPGHAGRDLRRHRHRRVPPLASTTCGSRCSTTSTPS
jgi:type I restriction enzyme R subunit